MQIKIQSKQRFATTFRPLTKNIMVLIYRSTLLAHLYHKVNVKNLTSVALPLLQMRDTNHTTSVHVTKRVY